MLRVCERGLIFDLQIVDLATLTGACVVALGPSVAGIYFLKVMFTILFMNWMYGNNVLYHKIPSFENYVEYVMNPSGESQR